MQPSQHIFVMTRNPVLAEFQVYDNCLDLQAAPSAVSRLHSLEILHRGHLHWCQPSPGLFSLQKGLSPLQDGDILEVKPWQCHLHQSLFPFSHFFPIFWHCFCQMPHPWPSCPAQLLTACPGALLSPSSQNKESSPTWRVRPSCSLCSH